LLLVLLASVAQRAISLFRPNWTWLVPFTRLLINAAGALVLYFLVFKSRTLVVVADAFQSSGQYEKLAESVNGTLLWGVLGPWLWIWAGISVPIYAWYCLPHLRKMLRGKAGAASSTVSRSQGK
jgi:hypothetical protein